MLHAGVGRAGRTWHGGLVGRRWPQGVGLMGQQDAAPIRIGLALGGGAVRGAAHIGVLDVLDRAGLEPAVLTGTSAGALVGALYAAGASPSEISKLAHTLRWAKLVRPARTRK